MDLVNSFPQLGEQDIERRAWRNLLLGPSLWLPVGVGLLVLLFGTARMGPLAGLAGLAAIVWGIGSTAWRALFRFDHWHQKAAQQLRQELARQHREYLRQLRGRLRGDGDARTGECAKRLGDIHQRVLESDLFDPANQATWQQELSDQFVRLYDCAIQALERSYQLWRTARRMATDEARQHVQKTRDQLVQEVEKTISQLGNSLDQLQSLAIARETADADLASMRDELDRGLEIARQVEQRLEALEREVRTTTREVE